MQFDNRKQISNQSPGAKYLLIKRTDPDCTMVGVSPFLVNRCRQGVGGKPLKMNMLRSGELLVAKDAFQAQQYVKIIAFNSQTNVNIYEHTKLNKTRGVIRCRELIGVSDDEFLEEMKDQHASEIYRLKRKENGKETELGTYFVTFSTTNLP